MAFLERWTKKKALRARWVTADKCPDCNGVHVMLKASDGNIFAQAIMEPSIARSLAADLIRLSEGALH